MSAEQDQSDNEINWGMVTRRALLSGGAAAAAVLLYVLGREKPRPQAIVPATSPSIPSQRSSGRQDATSQLKRIQDFLDIYFSETVYTTQDRERFEQIYQLADDAFTRWARDVNLQYFADRMYNAYWNLRLGTDQCHQAHIEFSTPVVSFYDLQRTHFQVQLALGIPPTANELLIDRGTGSEVRNDALETLLASAIKLPPDFALDTNVSADMIVSSGVNARLQNYRAYATTSGLVGVVLEGPVLAPPIIENPFDIPEIIPVGIPSGFPLG